MVIEKQTSKKETNPLLKVRYYINKGDYSYFSDYYAILMALVGEWNNYINPSMEGVIQKKMRDALKLINKVRKYPSTFRYKEFKKNLYVQILELLKYVDNYVTQIKCQPNLEYYKKISEPKQVEEVVVNEF